MIDPKHIMTMPKFIPHTSIAPTTKDQLETAKRNAEDADVKLYAADAAHEKNLKQKKVTELKDKVGSLNTQVAEAHAAKEAAESAMDAIPWHEERKLKFIKNHNKADLHHKTLKDKHDVKKAKLVAAAAAGGGGRRRRRRRTRKTRRKKRKSKHHRRRKKHTKKRRRSRRKRRSRRR